MTPDAVAPQAGRPPTELSTVDEEKVAAFLATMDPDKGLAVRSLVHAWAAGGGAIIVGKVTIRLLVRNDGQYTAATVRAPREPDRKPSLEISRVVLESHGVDHDAWIHWSDEFADLAHHGFDPAERFPALELDDQITPAEIARLATGFRDLARMAGA